MKEKLLLKPNPEYRSWIQFEVIETIYGFMKEISKGMSCLHRL
jgi:hypothetical protein